MSDTKVPAWLAPIIPVCNAAGELVNELDVEADSYTVFAPSIKLTVGEVDGIFASPEMVRKVKALLAGHARITAELEAIAKEATEVNAPMLAVLAEKRAIARKEYADTRNLIAKTSPETAATLVKIRGAQNLTSTASQKVRDVAVFITYVNEGDKVTDSFTTMSTAADYLDIKTSALTGAYLTHASCARWQDAPQQVDFTITSEGVEFAVRVTRTK